MDEVKLAETQLMHAHYNRLFKHAFPIKLWDLIRNNNKEFAIVILENNPVFYDTKGIFFRKNNLEVYNISSTSYPGQQYRLTITLSDLTKFCIASNDIRDIISLFNTNFTFEKSCEINLNREEILFLKQAIRTAPMYDVNICIGKLFYKLDEAENLLNETTECYRVT